MGVVGINKKIQLNFNLLDTVSQSDKGHNDEICIAILQDELSSRLLDKQKLIIIIIKKVIACFFLTSGFIIYCKL